ncbi:hypothetical protein [Oceanobacillus arenosus]|nr:hypothetical protein [Oceanobacillus arenosus]
MGEQEKYTKVLKQMIDDTESNKIQTAEELIQKLIKELTVSKELSESY